MAKAAHQSYVRESNAHYTNAWKRSWKEYQPPPLTRGKSVCAPWVKPASKAPTLFIKSTTSALAPQNSNRKTPALRTFIDVGRHRGPVPDGVAKTKLPEHVSQRYRSRYSPLRHEADMFRRISSKFAESTSCLVVDLRWRVLPALLIPFFFFFGGGGGGFRFPWVSSRPRVTVSWSIIYIFPYHSKKPM